MSARGRGPAVVDQYGFVPTPAWAVKRLFEKWTPLSIDGLWVEPGAGSGAIIKAARQIYPEPTWHAVERQAKFKKRLFKAGAHVVTITNYLTWSVEKMTGVSVVLGNPDFAIARETKEIFRKICPEAEIVLLLRINFLGSDKRYDLFAGKEPDIFVLPNRPSFKEDGATDATEYAWFRWGPHDKQEGKVRMLNLTPALTRRS